MSMSVGEQRQRPSDQGVTIGRQRYLRAPQALHFPESEKVPETKRHLELRLLVYQFLKLAFAEHAHIGSDQFVYWDAANPRVCLAPDAFVRLGGPDELFGSWKVWERGAPHVAIEIISPSDEGEPAWELKLERYRQLGVKELVRFDAEAKADRLRIWDRVDNDLVEREPSCAPAASAWLGFWLEVQHPELGPSLRLSRDALGRELLPTPAEAARVEAEAAEARIRELEAQLTALKS